MRAEVGSAPVTRVAVIGAGAIGSVVAAALAKAGHQVSLCVRTAMDHLSVEHEGKTAIVPAAIVTNPADVGAVDWVFVATKTQDTAGTKGWLDQMVGPKTRIVLLQNGVDSAEIIRPLVGSAVVIPSIVYISAERVARGHVVHFFGVKLEVPQTDDTTALVDLLAPGGIDVHPQADFITAAWRKLICNVALNPITALTMQRFGVFRDPAIQDLSTRIIREAAWVGNAAGAHFPPQEIERIAAYCTELSPKGGTSMLYDRMAGNRLEYEHLTGTIVRLAQRYGIDAPYNNAIYALIAALDASLQLAPQPVALAAANDQAEEARAI
ncbi:MAG: 2-dehydropantoate 2-reductase [Rhizomicrobium sp.]